MPKKFSIVEKRKWLEQYETGQSEADIAHHSNCSIRTLRTGIDEARRDREVQIARTELIKKALFSHQEQLINKLKDISLALTLPPKEWAVLSWYKDGESIFKSVKTDSESEEKSPEIPKVTDVQSDMIQDLLKEHLKKDKLWKILLNREEKFSSHRSTRIVLQQKIIEILKDETGYDLVPGRDIKPPFLYSYTAGDLFYRMTLNWAFGNKNLDWQNDIIADDKAGVVTYQHNILAEVPGKEHDCKKKLVDAFKKMIELAEVTKVKDSFEDLDEATIKAKQAIEEIIMLGLVPGQCKVCRRLGM